MGEQITGSRYPQKGTLRYTLVSKDWSKYSMEEIAKVLGTDRTCVNSAIQAVKRKYGIVVKYRRVAGKQTAPKKGTMIYALAFEDWSDLTVQQIAEVLGTDKGNVACTIYHLWKRYGIRVRYKRDNRGRHRKEASVE